MSEQKHIADEPLSGEVRDLLAELEQDGWQADYSPTCRAWRLVQRERKWETSLYYDPTKAIEAAESVAQRAETTLAERARRCEELRKCFWVRT